MFRYYRRLSDDRESEEPPPPKVAPVLPPAPDVAWPVRRCVCGFTMVEGPSPAVAPPVKVPPVRRADCGLA